VESNAPVRMDARCGKATGRSAQLVRQPDSGALEPVSVATAQAGYLSGHIAADAGLQSNDRTSGKRRTLGRMLHPIQQSGQVWTVFIPDRREF
jgi:hypothetical protein